MSDAPFVLLTADEEVTLRRVAFGESPVGTLRAQDLSRLRRLRLIDEGKEPRLPAGGRVHFGRGLGEEIDRRLRDVRPAGTVDRRRVEKPGPVSSTRAGPGKA